MKNAIQEVSTEEENMIKILNGRNVLSLFENLRSSNRPPSRLTHHYYSRFKFPLKLFANSMQQTPFSRDIIFGRPYFADLYADGPCRKLLYIKTLLQKEPSCRKTFLIERQPVCLPLCMQTNHFQTLFSDNQQE